MRKIKNQIAQIFLGWMFAVSVWAGGDAVYMAVPPSIEAPMGRLCQLFSQKTSYECKITTAPIGHLYAHVMHGVAYDIFVSSDEVYTQGLLNANKTEASGNFVFALGHAKLGLVSLREPSASSKVKPILHEVIVLKDRKHPAATLAFMDFLHHQEACQIIQAAGFRCSHQIRLNA